MSARFALVYTGDSCSLVAYRPGRPPETVRTGTPELMRLLLAAAKLKERNGHG